MNARWHRYRLTTVCQQLQLRGAADRSRNRICGSSLLPNGHFFFQVGARRFAAALTQHQARMEADFCESHLRAHCRVGTAGDLSSKTARIPVFSNESEVFQNLSIILSQTASWCCYSSPVRVASAVSGFDIDSIRVVWACWCGSRYS